MRAEINSISAVFDRSRQTEIIIRSFLFFYFFLLVPWLSCSRNPTTLVRPFFVVLARVPCLPVPFVTLQLYNILFIRVFNYGKLEKKKKSTTIKYKTTTDDVARAPKARYIEFQNCRTSSDGLLLGASLWSRWVLYGGVHVVREKNIIIPGIIRRFGIMNLSFECIRPVSVVITRDHLHVEVGRLCSLPKMCM